MVTMLKNIVDKIEHVGSTTLFTVDFNNPEQVDRFFAM